MAKKLLFVFGTRPEAIKLARLIALAKKDPRYSVVTVSTGQHREMLAPLLEFFEIRPNYDLDLMKPNQNLNNLIAEASIRLREIYLKEKPNWVLIQGDTATCLAAAQSAFLEKIPVGHIEAGLRSYDLHSPWPEEYVRRVVSLASNLHFAPTEVAANCLAKEDIPANKVLVTGNTVIDTLQYVAEHISNNETYVKLFADKYKWLSPSKKMLLVTTHRRESFSGGLENILEALVKLAERKDVQIVFSVHMNPEVRKRVATNLTKNVVWQQNISENPDAGLVLCDPIPYLDFVYLMKKCHFILSDSGGLQEEAPALGKPVLVMREVTERTEAITAGTSILVGYDKARIIKAAKSLLDDENKYRTMAQSKNPFGDGHSCERILSALNI